MTRRWSETRLHDGSDKPPEPAKIWALRKGKRFSAFLFGSRSQAENYKTCQDTPDEWKIVRFVEAPE